MKLHTGDLTSCSYCPWKGQDKMLLYRHIMLKHKEQWERDQASKDEHFKCPECGEFMMDKGHLTRHIGIKHKKNTYYWRSVSNQSQT